MHILLSMHLIKGEMQGAEMAQMTQISAINEQFDVVEALYQEAENMRPSADKKAAASSASVISSRPVIKSRAPQKVVKPVPVIDRIEDLYLEAEAMREMSALSDEAALATPETEAPSEPPSHDDDFGIPATFGGVDVTAEAQTEITETDEKPSEETASDTALSDEMSPDINDPLPDLPDLPDLPEFEKATPEVSADDAQLVADMMPDAPTNPEATDNPEDNEITRQLDDVRLAVEEAQDSLSGEDEPVIAEDTSDAEAMSDRGDTDTLQDEPLLKPGPELAQFIGETVRDVLDTELPVMVRGLVNEALSERRAGYGNQAGTQIGLRTKSTKEFQ